MMSKQEGAEGREPWTVKEVVKVVVSFVLLGIAVFALSFPAIMFYNSSHYQVRECTVDYANYYEQRTVATSKNLVIHTSDCGTLRYGARVSGGELEALESRINEFRGQRLSFGFGEFQFWSGPRLVYSVEGLD